LIERFVLDERSIRDGIGFGLREGCLGKTLVVPFEITG
jgi:hypothetical protein